MDDLEVIADIIQDMKEQGINTGEDYVAYVSEEEKKEEE